MVDKRRVVIICFIIIIVGALAFGINSISGITGHTITGSVIGGELTPSYESSKINDLGTQINETEDINDTQNKSG